MKLGNYSVEDIIKKDLDFLIPFYIFNFEVLIRNDRKHGEIEEDELSHLRQDYVKIRHYLDTTCRAGGINEYEKRAILDLSKKVLDNLSKGSKKVKEEVESIMGGKILDYEAKDILNQGIEQGISQGIEQGISQGIEQGISQGIEQKTLQVYQNCIKRGMSEEDARAIAGMDPTEADQPQISP